MKRLLAATIAVLTVLLAACGGGGGGGGSRAGTYALTVYAPDGTTPFAGAWVDVLDDTQAFVGTRITGADGLAVFRLRAGTYTMRVRAQGYERVPAQALGAQPFDIVARGTTSANVTLTALAAPGSVGMIHGNADVAGLLVVAEDSVQGIAYSGLSGANGDYAIFNMLPGDYSVTAFRAGFLSNEVAEALVAAEDAVVNLDVTRHASPTLGGHLSFLATANGVVDITLVHPLTRDAIPGLATTNSGTTYLLSNVPAGDYLAWATFANDGYVMDPDWIDKNGGFPAALEVTMGNVALEKDFSITDAVPLVSPTNTADVIVPAVVTTATPTFTWSDYPSAQEYVVEVFDLQGNTVWGGYVFDGVSQTATFNHPAIGDVTSVVFNFNATPAALVDGETYLWRVTAFKWSTQRGGWVAISASEDQLGLFRVDLP